MKNISIVLFFVSSIVTYISAYGESFDNVLSAFDIKSSSDAVEFLFDSSTSHYTIFLSSALRMKNRDYIVDIFSHNKSKIPYDLYNKNVVTHFIISSDAIRKALLAEEIDVFLSYISSKIPSGSPLYVYFVGCSLNVGGKSSYQDLLFQDTCFHQRFLIGLFMQLMYQYKSFNTITNKSTQDRIVLKFVKD